MSLEELRAYVYWVLTLVLVVLLYRYIYHLYRSERDGKRDYERYGRLALDDELTDTPVEKMERGEKRNSRHTQDAHQKGDATWNG